MCKNYGIVFFQDHCLLSYELLNMIPTVFSLWCFCRCKYRHCYWYTHATLALMWCIVSSLSKQYRCDEPQCAQLLLRQVKVLFHLRTYIMLTDGRNDKSFDEYVDLHLCKQISSLFTTTDSVYIVIASDFNCSNQLPSSFRQPHSVNCLSWFTSSCTYHLITVTTFTRITYHCLYISLQT